MKQKLKQDLIDSGQYKEGAIENAIVKPIFRTSTNYRRFPKVIPKLDPTRITESAGYITAKQRIENMILAGQRLVEYRKGRYDFEADQPVDYNAYDPTRSKNFDMADASMMANELEAKKLEKSAHPHNIKHKKEDKKEEEEKENSSVKEKENS